MADDPEQVGVLENPFAPDLFADDAFSFSLKDGTLRITLSTLKFGALAGGRTANVVVGRVVMPLLGAQRLALGLYDFLKKMGVDASAMATDGQPMQ